MCLWTISPVEIRPVCSSCKTRRLWPMSAVQAAAGVNAVRLPVGYWALADTAAQAAPFVEGAAKYIDLAMQWGQQHGTL